MNNRRKRFAINKIHFVIPALLAIATIAVVAHHIINVGIIFAAGNAGPGSGAAIRPGCTWELAVSHCTEATWRYYAVNQDYGSNIIGTLDGAIVKGTVDSTAPGTIVTGCENAGGYWRYALVSNKDWTNDAGVPFSKGDQVGVGSIGSGGGEHSNKFGGREQYSANPKSGGGGFDWDFVHQQFEESKAKGYLQTGMTWDASSALGWFCAEPPGTPSTPNLTGFNCTEYGDYTINYGRTYVEAAVQNLSARYGSKTAATDVNTSAVQGRYKNGWKVTSSGSDAQDPPNDDITKAYARPGDSIQFRHTLCWGNQNVTGTWDFEYGGARDEQKTVKAWQYNNKRNTFQIVASPATHAFDGASGDSSFIGTGWYTIEKTSPTFSSSTVGPGRNITGETFSGGKTYRREEVQTTRYGARFYSPIFDNNYDADNPRYSCLAQLFKSNKYVLPGFQIPGFAAINEFNGDCSALAVTHNDVGVKVTQEIDANIVKSWVARRTEITGTCSCSGKTEGCASCPLGQYSQNEEGTKKNPALDGSTVTISEKPESEWQSRKAKVNPAETIYTHVPKWTTTKMDEWYLPSTDSGGGKGDDVNRPHERHFEDYDDALGSAGTWGDGRYNGGCNYHMTSGCTQCNHGRPSVKTGELWDYDAYGVYYKVKDYILTFYCEQPIVVNPITDPNPSGHQGLHENYSLSRVQATNRTGSWAYPYRSVNYGDVHKKAEVYTPYNYTTSVSTNIPTTPLYVGEAVDVSATVVFNPRYSQHVSNVPYATISKPTSIRFVQFAVSESTDFNNIHGVDIVKGNNMATSDACDYYASIRQGNCVDVDTSLMNKRTYNEYGNYSGQRYNFGSYTRTAPDLSSYPAGTKYCVAISVFPSDSYDAPNDGSIPEYDRVEGNGMSSSGQYYNVSGLTCRTIAKKPNFQIWGAGAYTGSSIRTSTSKKDVGADFAKTDFNPTGLFGSWSEYTAIAKRGITGFATGATLGYKKYNLSANKGGYQGTVDSGNPNHCKDLSIMSIAHVCGSTIGNSGVNASSNVLLNRIEARYNSNRGANSIGSASSPSQYQTMNNDNTSFHYATASSIGGISFPKSTDYTTNNTFITYSSGNISITGNICYGNGGCSDATTIKDQDTGGTTYTGAAQLPQSIIIADGNINIDESVTRIDSWLIARNGNINTCTVNGKPLKVGEIYTDADENTEYRTGNFGGDLYLSSRICDKTLIINGPVFAKSLDLVRTAGAWSGGGQDYGGDVRYRDYTDPVSNGSVAPAEIFNLRADAYLWAYNQAQRYSEAVVTYTRELAPRY